MVLNVSDVLLQRMRILGLSERQHVCETHKGDQHHPSVSVENKSLTFVSKISQNCSL